MNGRTDKSTVVQLRPPGWAIAAIVAVAAWFVITHFLHVFREVINWDEFALLERADRTLRFGNVEGGGRPGLVSIWLMPFVRDCVDSVRSVVNARLLWQAITLTYLVGVYFLVRRWFLFAGRSDEGRLEGILAVALLAFIPAFVTWSVQVRTDQPALASAVWGGVALLSTGYLSAVVAGAFFGIALLCTQKAVYVIGLCGLLFMTAAAYRLATASTSARTETVVAAGRIAVVIVTAALVIGAYLFFVPTSAHLVSGAGMGSALDAMGVYRQWQGYRIYTVHADRLVVHWVLFAMLVVWTCGTALKRNLTDLVLVATSWSVLLLGFVVIRVHGSSFPYFWMTAGLFLAVALAMAARGPLLHAGRLMWLVVVSLIVFTALQSSRESTEMLADTQWEQRETLRLVFESSLRHRRGYQVEGALYCARDPSPFPVMFSQGIWRHFKDSPDAAKRFVAEFRNRPVAYIVESYRMNQFPLEVRRFWQEHYVWYGRSLFIAGSSVNFPIGLTVADIVVPGAYRWVPAATVPDASIVIGSTTLQPLETLQLEGGRYRIDDPSGTAIGSLMIADLPPPKKDAYPAFYHIRQIRQLGGRL